RSRYAFRAVGVPGGPAVRPGGRGGFLSRTDSFVCWKVGQRIPQRAGPRREQRRAGGIRPILITVGDPLRFHRRDAKTPRTQKVGHRHVAPAGSMKPIAFWNESKGSEAIS